MSSETPTPTVSESPTESLSFGALDDFPSTINDRLLKLEEEIAEAGREYSDSDENESQVDDSLSPTPAALTTSQGTFTDTLNAYKTWVSDWTNKNQTATVYSIYGIILIIIFVMMLWLKPKLVMKKYKGKKCIDWPSFLKWCIGLTVILGSIAVGAKFYL